jgi:hypothetical protein
LGAASGRRSRACQPVGAIARTTTGDHRGQKREWIVDVDAASGSFFLGAWLIILMGFLGIVAFLGFYEVLREAGPVMVLAPALGAVGLTLVTVSHLIPIAMSYELVPGYVEAGPVAQASLATTADTLASIALVTNSAGNFLGWGLATPLVGVAILQTRLLPRWIGWLGLAVGLLAGWVGMLSPVAEPFEAISTLGFFGFFVFLLAMGVAMLRSRVGRAAATA